MIDPYQWLEHAPHVKLEFADLPAGEMGRWIPSRSTIVLDKGLSQAERRCTLMHELVHRLHNDLPVSSDFLQGRQEVACRKKTASLLIGIPALLDALMWSYNEQEQEIADHLWVDVETLRDRLANLTDDERTYIVRRLRLIREHVA